MTSVPNSPITNSSTSAATTNASVLADKSSGKNSIAGDFNSFLTLLTTQLKYQDPLSPMDTTQFTQQLAMFANVEQTSNVNTNIKSLITLSQGSQAAAAVNYIGKTVQVDNPTAALAKDGTAQFTYSLSGKSAATALVVSNSLGRPVYAGPGETNAGSHTFTWNGKDTNGNPLPAGNYTLSVSAADSNSKDIPVVVGSMGQVQGVDSSDGTLNLLVNGVEVPFTKVVSVRN
ncbi:MAG: flagellar hook assembly protein FlgD [Gemmatimonas sp.]